MSSWLQRGLFTRKRSSSTASIATQQTDELKSPGPSANSSLTNAQQHQQNKIEDQREDQTGDDIGPLPSDKVLEDVDGLFSRLSVAEMRRYDQRLQKHMEQMRQQMRKVAANHYPELIDAADSVVAMDTLSASISMQMSRLRGMVEGSNTSTVKQTQKESNSDSGDGDDRKREKMYAVAAQVKVLVDTQELIWKALGARHFLQATLLFLIAREIHERLANGEATGDGIVDPMLAFPVIERMWATVAPLSVQIADKARQMLSGSDDANTETCMSAICAIALLEDVDAEVACAEFLARRSEALWPQLSRIEALEDCGGVLEEERLYELMGHIHQTIADYVLIFGVPSDHSRDYASWMVTTLASICADAELSLHPSLQLLWDTRPLPANSTTTTTASPAAAAAAPPPPLSSRRSEMQSLKARRRKSSIAGSVLSSTVIAGTGPLSDAPTTPKIGTYAFSDTHRPWRAAASQGGLAKLSSNVIVARYLPPAVARFSPPLARILDVQWEPEHHLLDEADEEQDMQGLAQFLGDPRALTRILSTRVQPVVERCARRSLQMWWQGTKERLQESLGRAVGHKIRQIADATRVSKALAAWEADAREDRRWARGFAWSAVAGNALAQDIAVHSLHRSLVEPLLRVRANELLRARVEEALALADEFVESSAEVKAGHLPWRMLSDAMAGSSAAGDALRELAADVSSSLVFQPAGVRELETRVFAGIEGAWVDAQAWWTQLSGAAAEPEALACARHFGQQWDLLVERLELWADKCVKRAGPVDEAQAVRGIRGAWAMVALANVARHVLTTEAAQLVRACWAQAGIDERRLVHRLQCVGQALLQPWQHVLGRDLANAWMQRFDALYYRVPKALCSDAATTRQDVVNAWRLVAPSETPWATRYTALRRLATTTAASASASASVDEPAPSQAVRGLVVELLAQVQAVGGLSAIAAGLLDGGQQAMRQRIGAVAGAELAAALSAKRRSEALSEWDGRQIAADIGFVLDETLCLGDDTVAALVSQCMQMLEDRAAA
ncbi:hypothetical protein LPJ64_005085 [Coemansia asiatica]|uniref:Conserved oligomeric Golgi complex subunit 1 n=1 Tax=Coemansia asiatica TaxID=1052880 RepID=A0A9W8CGQ3_9FUNG|nr:hypothetical protein LPJ64_005085 [Coemansia asiatica]